MTKFDWEAYTPYRNDDILNTFKSFSASTNVTDAIGNFTQSFASSLSGLLRFDGIFDIIGLTDTSVNPNVKSGVYRGWNQNTKKMFKATPLKNEYEQGTPFIHQDAIGPKQKNSYLRNQLFKQD